VLYRGIRPLLFSIAPETVHDWTRTALIPAQRLLERRATRAAALDPLLAQELWGLTFPNPLGLAAGFDKNGELPHVWAALGFGFAELGTVTAQAQTGNPPPRLFRLADQRALINRLGFNNLGAVAVARRLGERLRRHRPAIPIGINLGKSRVTALEHALDDYRASFTALVDCADYVAINVSSPNTPGLRDLQSETQLARLLEALQVDNQRWAAERHRAPRPLLVKLAPDLDDEALRGIVSVALGCGCAGVIATNTTVERGALPVGHPLAAEPGGLSGAPLRARATAVIRRLYALSGGQLPIIGVGGIGSAADAYEKIRAGASLVQVYTGFVYEGPAFPRRLCRELRLLLRRDGFGSISRAVGVDA
jgi:dihydroorotate dehydrogenase